MSNESLGEVTDLERWIVEHPEVIDPRLKIITTQFNRWGSDKGRARERPDIIGLSDTGELVVIELKRGGDPQIHLQALTYAALASSFTLDLLAQEHADWHSKTFRPAEKMTVAQARQELESFIDADEEVEEELLFALPKIILVAESFPSQVLTTIQWLSEVAPDLSIECHQYQLFNVPTEENKASLVASFNRMFPVNDFEENRLRAQSPRVAAAKEQRSRQRKSVSRIVENDLIPTGSSLEFRPSGQVNQEIVAAVESWLAEDPIRRDFTWDPHRKDPLRWGFEPEKRWSPSALRNELFKRAEVPVGTFAATLAWFYEGNNLAAVANRAPSHLEQ